MPLRVIEVDPADTYYSIRARLLLAERGRTVLVLPAAGEPIQEVQLVLLRRLADRHRLDIGLVTGDRAVARLARAAGFPAFATVSLAEHFRPGWWRTGRRTLRAGFGPGEDRQPPGCSANGAEANSRHAPIVLFLALFSLVAALVAAAIYFVPVASIRLRPEARPVQTIAELRADPALSRPSDSAIPARSITIEQEWESAGKLTGNAAADRPLFRARALNRLESAAPQFLAMHLEADEQLVPSSVETEVIAERFDVSANSASMTMRARLTGLAVKTADIEAWAANDLGEALPDGLILDPAGLQVSVQPPSQSAREGNFQVTARAIGRPEIDPRQVAASLRGMPASEAARRLSAAIHLAEPPTVDVWPSWWWGGSRGRLPLRAANIQIEVWP